MQYYIAPTDPIFAMVPKDEAPTGEERITKLDIKAQPDGRYRIIIGHPEHGRVIVLPTYAKVQEWIIQHLREVG